MWLRRIVSPLLAGLFALGLLVSGPPDPLAAQQTGIIEGTVIAGATLRPLAGAQISIAGTGIGTLSTASGAFRINGVPAGAQTLRVTMLGYALYEEAVTVVSGEVISVRIELRSQALALDELVVTGTAGGTQRRAIGNVVDQVRVADIVQISPATSVNQLIGQRSPGVQFMPSSGQIGAGAPIHIRGISSLSLDASPIIYIDGVRMDSRNAQGPSARGGSQVSRLDDLNPEDIQSIEIIKGPAAATLYGTEASNGVIQVVTKRGASGKSQIDVSIRTGTNWIWNPEARQGFTYAGDPYKGQLDSINIYAHERDNGLGSMFQYGNTQSYTVNATGGNDALRYFASAAWNDETGVFSYNWQKRFTGRSNLDFAISENLGAKVGLGYVQRTYRGAQVTLTTDAFGNMTWGSPAFLNTRTRGFRNAPPEASEEVEALQSNDRVTGSLELNHNPTSWLTQRLVAGVDVGSDRTSVLYPRHPNGTQHYWGGLSLGSKTESRETNRVITLDWGASASFRPSEAISSTSSVGFQFYKRGITTLGASASNFAAPPLTTISAGATTAGSEAFVENATVGMYLQQVVGWQDRLFITGAVRGDDNSAFGADYSAAIYPKLSGTWVLHEEDFWTFDWVNQFRVRGAWGAAGQQPDAFAAVRLYSPVTGFNNEPGLQPEAIGNPELKPERSYELEIGFDAAFLNERLQIEFTRYDRTVRDAMVNRPLPASEGFPGSQIVNIGEVSAWGNEISVNYEAIQRPNLTWSVGMGFATMKNRIESLGGLGSLGTGAVRQIEGRSIGDNYWRRVVSAEFVSGTNGAVKNILCDGGAGKDGLEFGGAPVPCDNAPWLFWGHSEPTWQASFNQTLSLGRNFRIYATVDANGGHIARDGTEPAAHTTYCTTRACRFQDDPIVMSYRAIGRDPLGLYQAGFARLREVSLNYNLPSGWVAPIGASSSSVSFAMRNLMMLWTAQDGWDTPRAGNITVPIGNGRIWDPETRSQGLGGGYQTVMPPLASAILSVRLSF